MITIRCLPTASVLLWCSTYTAFTENPLPAPPTPPVETVTIFFVQEVVGFQTEATETLAQDFSHYMSRTITPKPLLELHRTSIWTRLPPGPVPFDLIFPYTEPQGLLACLEHDLVPLAAVAPNDQSAFQDSVVVARKGCVPAPRDLLGKRWCVGGRRPGFDFYLMKHLMRNLLGPSNLASIQLIHIHTNRALVAEMRRDLLHYILTDKADFAVVRRYEFETFSRYYPRCAERLELLPWFVIPPVSLETWVATPRHRFPAMLKYRDELCRMHLDPEGEQYLMLVGFQRVMPIDHDYFFSLTNYLPLVESLDTFAWP